MHWIALLAPCPSEPALAQAGAQQALGWLALRFSPRVTLLDEAVLLEVSASARLFGGVPRLRAQLAQQWQQLQQAQPLAASAPWQAQGRTALVALGRLRAGLLAPALFNAPAAALPLASLSAAREHLELLERIGCRNWGDLKRLPRAGVVRRFGMPLLDALDRARGHKPETYPWLTLPEVFDEKLELQAQVESASALLPGITHLLVRLQAWLLARQSGLRALRLTWHLDPRRNQACSAELVIRTAVPARDLAHIARLAAEHLAQTRLAAPVHSISLCSLEVQALEDATAASDSLLIEERKHGDSLCELIERLSARLGESQVRSWQPRADYRPEHMQDWVAAQGAMAQRPGPARAGAARPKKKTAPALRSEALYPNWLLAEPLKLASQGDRPLYQGPLTLLAGPQRLQSSGWSGGNTGAGRAAQAPALRDYFIARSAQAGLLWIYRQRPAGDSADWYLHGIFS